MNNIARDMAISMIDMRLDIKLSVVAEMVEDGIISDKEADSLNLKFYKERMKSAKEVAFISSKSAC